MSADLDLLITDRTRALLAEKFADRDPGELRLQIRECLRFLYIISRHKGSFIPLSKDVDEVWHELIVQTRSYRELCDALPGERFIDHESISLDEYSAHVGKRVAVEQFLAWIPLYVQYFGEFEADIARHWVVCEFLTRELGMSLREINDLGKQHVHQ